ncbi:MAG: isopentenyl-diphosphate Delta-isomerase [Candidatus Omnitrophica bacterium]|nr:isopentenyl-diphosphate Delta-isomerase [Candidatus Omnitrophota bacterium]
MPDDKYLNKSDDLIIVDKEDNILGYKSKDDAHRKEGGLHRAFSIFIFNDQRQLLIQQRSEKKLLWPLFWSNSACSHPRRNEEMQAAAQRRLKEELGINVPLFYLFKFEYSARYKDIGVEHELCAVFIGRANKALEIDRDEIADWKFVDYNEISVEIKQKGDIYTPWFKIEWQIMQDDYFQIVNKLFTGKHPL